MMTTEAIYDAWGNRASLTHHKTIVNGERVFHVGGYTIQVPDDHEAPAKVAHQYRSWGRSENPMPNMSFSDGEMRIPVEDFADLILRRVPAGELAEGLWHDEEVRARFVDCMADRYAGGNIEDADRRSFLNKIQVAIHAKAIDRAIERLNNMESNARAYGNHYRWRKEEHGIYDQLYRRYHDMVLEMREKGLLDDEGVRQRMANTYTPEQIESHIGAQNDPIMRESAGEQWRESRDYWRAALEKAFPEPVAASGEN